MNGKIAGIVVADPAAPSIASAPRAASFLASFSSARAAWALAGAVLLGIGASLIWKPAPPPRYAGLAPVRARTPKRVAGFVSTGDLTFAKDVRDALAAADILGRSYRDAQTGEEINFLLIGGTDRSALHDPRSCMIGAGWRLENDHVETIPETNIPVRVCRIVGGKNGSQAGSGFEAMYLYVVSGKTINEVTQIRTQMALSAIIGRKNTPVCFVRFMRPLAADASTDAKSHARLAQFASQMWRTLNIPEAQLQAAPGDGDKSVAPVVTLREKRVSDVAKG